jgi:hypothetical protein
VHITLGAAHNPTFGKKETPAEMAEDAESAEG